MPNGATVLPDNVVTFPVVHSRVAEMPSLQKKSLQDNSPAPAQADSGDAFELQDEFMRGLLEWQTATLPDGRAVLVVRLAVPNGPPETRQILMSRVTAHRVAEALDDVAEALHPVA